MVLVNKFEKDKKMISFIVIGKNEAKNISRCFKSIRKTIEYNKLTKYEVIYVDSNSTDNSIEIAKSFKGIDIFKITGVCNAAIGRNIGAKESKGNVLFFIDGDMEIMPEFLPLVYSENNGLKYNFVSGQFIDVKYTHKGEFIEKVPYYRDLNCDKYFSTTGGIFLITRELWNLVDGMKNKYKRSQEVEFALRLSKKGFLLLRKKETIAKHYTVDYMDSKRMWKMLFGGYHFYARGLLYREHIFNKYIYKIIIRNDSTFVMLIFFTTLSIIFNCPMLYYLYLFSIISRVLLQREKNLLNVIIKILYHIIMDLNTIFSFFFFYPREIKKYEIKYTKV